jgi:hypothetical protein
MDGNCIMASNNSSNYWPAQCVKSSLGCFFIGGILCGLILALERSGVDMRQHWLMGFIQRIGGGLAVGGIACALGLFFLAMAVIGAKQADGQGPAEPQSNRKADISQTNPS